MESGLVSGCPTEEKQADSVLLGSGGRIAFLWCPSPFAPCIHTFIALLLLISAHSGALERGLAFVPGGCLATLNHVANLNS